MELADEVRVGVVEAEVADVVDEVGKRLLEEVVNSLDEDERFVRVDMEVSGDSDDVASLLNSVLWRDEAIAWAHRVLDIVEGNDRGIVLGRRRGVIPLRRGAVARSDMVGLDCKGIFDQLR